QIRDGRVKVAPLFALMGGQGEYRPLFLTLLERSGREVRELARELLCSQFAKLWLTLSLRFGLILEAHGQDLLLEMSATGQPSGRFFIRDFEGLQVDWELRERLGLSRPADMPYSWDWHNAYAGWPYPYGHLVWYKWRISLNQYLHRVLKDLEGF